MKAVVYNEYGPPDVLHVEEVPKPVPKNNEILVKVHATTINFGDLFARNLKKKKSKDFHMPSILFPVVKMTFGGRKPKVKVLGSEFSGVVESVGDKVTRFRAGDEVFGYPGQAMGAYAEYLTIKESKMIGKKPQNLTHEEAACLPYGTIMAFDHLEKVDLKPGMKVLVNGASGGIGSIGMQLAKTRGAEVTGVCGPAMIDYVKKLGANKVIDYRKTDFTRNGEKYHVIYDILGKRKFSEVKDSLTENGIYLNASFKGRKVVQSILNNPFSSKKIICAFASENPSKMKDFKELAERGVIKPEIDRIFEMEEAAIAHKYIEDGKKKGNVVIRIA
jgi:NADPH:quinone reductase-like Zn-dependent oxidoreductase